MSEWRDSPAEWDSGNHRRVSTPRFTWGTKVMLKFSFTGTEAVVDAGCGSGPHIARMRQRAEAPLSPAAYRENSYTGTYSWGSATPDQTALRLAAAGFTEIETGLTSTLTTFSSAVAFSEFVRSVVLRARLDALPDKVTHDAFAEDVTTVATRDQPAFTLDYWRLNLPATRPGAP